jgi:hypothetical protein
MANTMSNANKAAWLTEAKQNPLKVDHAPMPSPGPDEVVIKNKAVAVNPVDWKIQDSGLFIQSYPNVLGMSTTFLLPPQVKPSNIKSQVPMSLVRSMKLAQTSRTSRRATEFSRKFCLPVHITSNADKYL